MSPTQVPFPRPGGARAAPGAAAASGDGWRGPREAVALATAPSPWQRGGLQARGGGPGAKHLPSPAQRWRAEGLLALGIRACLNRVGLGWVTGSTQPLLQGGGLPVLILGASAQGGASTREGSEPALGMRQPRSSEDNPQHYKSEK